MKRIAALAALVLGLTAAPAYAINDVLVPGDNCAPDNAQAVGHPAFTHEQADPVGPPPFSANNPGDSTGAQAGEHQQATDNCPNA